MSGQSSPVMQYSNRALRRAAARAKKATERVVPLPSPFDEWAVFDGIESILNRLSTGEIDAANGRPVFRDASGELCQVCPAISGWITTWERIDKQFNLQLLQDPLAKLHNKLNTA